MPHKFNAILRHILRICAVMFFTAFGASMAFAGYAFSGGVAANVTAGSTTARSGLANNYLNHGQRLQARALLRKILVCHGFQACTMEERLRLTDEYNALKEISTRQTLEMIEVCSAGPSARCSAMLAEAREFLEWDETINDAGNYISARINADMFGTDSAGYLPLDNTSNLDRLAVDVLSQVQSGAITSEQATAQIVRSLVQRDGTAKIVGGVLEIGGVGLCAVGNVVCALGVASAVLGADKLAEGTAQIVTGKDQLSLIEQGLVAGGGYSAEQAAHIRDMLEAGTAVAALGAGGIIAITKAGKLIGVTRVAPNRTPSAGSVSDANFAQNNLIPPTKAFTKEGSELYSDLAGKPIKTVGDLTDALKSGAIKPSDIPVDYVNMNGTSLILNTRTSTALTNAGIPKSQWFGRNQTGAEAFPGKTFDQLAADQLARNGLPPTGAPALPGGQ